MAPKAGLLRPFIQTSFGFGEVARILSREGYGSELKIGGSRYREVEYLVAQKATRPLAGHFRNVDYNTLLGDS